MNALREHNEQLINQLNQMTEKHEQDRQIFKNEIGKQHIEMEKHFEKMQQDHVDRINSLKK